MALRKPSKTKNISPRPSQRAAPTDERITSATVALADCVAHERNYNRHPDSQVADIAESLQTFGQVKPVVVQLRGDGKYNIIAGHGVTLGARKLGWDKIEARIVPASWSKTKALAYLAADNELAKRGDPDQAQLAKIVADIAQAEGEAIAKLAAGDAKALRDLMAQANPIEETADAGELIDKAAELQKKWNVQRGDLWQCGKHRILCGDSTNAEDVARVMQGDLCELVITDPPYGVSYADKNKFLNAISPGNRIQTEIKNDHESKDKTQELWRNAFGQMARVMEPGAVVYCFMPQGGDQMMMMMMMMGAGIEPRHELIWLKNNHVLGRADYAYKHEPILYAWKDGGHKYYGGFQTSIIEIAKPQKSDLHPTTKPVELIQRLVNNSSNQDGIIFDLFIGSGTTLVACEQTGRIGRGIEIEPRYVAVSLERLSLLGLECKRIESDNVKSNGKASTRRKK